MTKSSTPNDLIKNLYEPEIRFQQTLNEDEKQEFARLKQVQNLLNSAYLEPSERSLEKILEHARKSKKPLAH
jgi:catechol-2,3-dioxygenase